MTTYPGGNTYPITEWLINGTWTDLSSRVRQGDGEQGIEISSRGRANEQGQPSATTSRFEVNNRDGVLSNRNPTGTYYGLLPRGTQIRHSAGVSTGECYIWSALNDLVSNSCASTADKAVLDITGDLEVQVDVQPRTWFAPNSNLAVISYHILAAKWEGAGKSSWLLAMSSLGQINLVWSADGTNALRSGSTVNIPTTTGRICIKATIDVDNGAAGHTVTFYTASTITGAYTILGSAVITAGTTSIFSSTAALTTGGSTGIGNQMQFGGRHYGMRVYNGIGGTEVARVDTSTQSLGDTTWSDGLATPNTWTLGGSARMTSDRVRFVGELASAPQYWDKAGTDAWIPIEAGGLIRRLAANPVALRSSMYRRFSQLSGITDYWPMEDGVDSTSIGNVSSGGQAAKVSGVTFAADSTLPGTETSVQFNSATSTIVATPKSAWWANGTLDFLVYMKFPSLPASLTTFLTLFTTGSARRIEVALNTTQWLITFYDATNVVLSTQGISFASYSTPATGQWIALSLLLTTSGGNVNWTHRTLMVNQGGSFASLGPISYAGTVGRLTQINLKAAGATEFNGAGFCHMAAGVFDFGFYNSDTYNATNAYLGETAIARMVRLASEEGIPLAVEGVSAESAVMGYQTVSTFMDLIYSCAAADMGILTDSRDALALYYQSRQILQLRRDVTLSLTSSHLADVPLPTDDDSALFNDVTVSRTGGSDARYVQTTGSLGTVAVGVRQNGGGATLDLGNDSDLYNVAGWLAHVGTWDEPRFPQLVIGMHRTQIAGNATLSGQVRGMDVGSVVTLTGFPSWMPPDSVAQLIQGYSEILHRSEWTITYNTTPAGVYNTAVYDQVDVVGTPRYDTSGSTLNGSLTSNATTVVLAYSTAGDNWTMTAGSYPFNIKVGGEVITLTAAPSGSTSPQTFTGCTRAVNGVVKAHNANEPVTLADTRYYSL